MKCARLSVLTLALVAALSLGACSARARHVAVVADASVSQAVFAVDDAEFAACPRPPAARAAWCERADPIVKQALVDVKAVTQALKDTPAGGGIPRNFPSLLASLDSLKTIVGDLSGPIKPTLAASIQHAIDVAIGVLQAIIAAQGGH